MEGLLLAAAAVIVTYNSENAVEQCLDALTKVASNITPIVVDNGSSDRTLKRVRARPGVQLITNEENRGFAAAVNQGIRSSNAEFILLLNPDVSLLTSVDALVDATRQHGLAAGKLVDRDGNPQAGFSIRRFPTAGALIFEILGVNRLWRSNPVNRLYRYLDRNLDQPGDVEQPAGAFLMTRRDVWEKLGGFDESFHPIWFEDVDYCRRARSAGYRIAYLPCVIASHAGGHSIAQLPPGSRALYWYVSLLRYAARHLPFLGYRAVCAAVVLSSVPRMIAGMIQAGSLTPVTAFWKMFRFAGLCLVSRGRSAARRSDF